MKTLLLLRHAKSDWGNAHLSDHDRPLNDRGLKDAPRMGKLLKKEDLTPNAIVSSTAVRAATTAELVALAADFEGTIRYTDKLYQAGVAELVEVARRLDDSATVALLVGHNPGMEELVEALCGHEEVMPTAAVACFQLPVDLWSDFTLSTKTRLIALWRPKEL